MTIKNNIIGIRFTGSPNNVRETVDLAKMAEKEGIESFWFAENYFLRDAISNVSCVAFSTKRIGIGCGVLNPYTRNPVLVAETMATLNELSDGRMRLGLGTGVISLVENMGIELRHPVRGMSEAVEMIRRLLSGEEVNFAGSMFSANHVRLGHNPYLELAKTDFEILPLPIYLAAVKPKMLELAGAIADGVLFTAGYSAKNVREAIPRIEEGARKSGKSMGDLRVAAYIASNLGKASTEIKGFVAFSVAHSRTESVASASIPKCRVKAIRDAVLSRGIRAAADLVTEDLIDEFTACGTKRQIQSKVEEFRSAGVTEPILAPIGGNPEELIHGVS
jgi:5,10-methylenetetrahydromethanopterin reductase